MSAATMRAINGRHVLLVLAGFFGTMFAVNAVFVYYAVSSFNGMESDAYEIGLHYNKRIAADGRQAALGWSHRVTFAEDGSVRVAMQDRKGAPVSGLRLAGDIARPAADRFTRQLAFRETSAGNYSAPIPDLSAGNWIVTLEGAQGDAAYHIKERLWLKPRS
jgi:nitrogen fixation protein FixH